MTDKKNPVGHESTTSVSVVEKSARIDRAEAFLLYAIRNRLRRAAEFLPDGAFDLSANVRAGHALN